MCRSPHPDHWPSRFDVIDDMLHLIVGQIAKPRRNDHQVGGLQGFQTRDVIVDVGIDVARRGIDGKHDRTLKPMMF